MKICSSCWKNQEKINGYLQGFQKIEATKECQIHPILENWRVFRTLNTLKVWSLEQAGYKHPNCRGVDLVVEYGYVHRRTAECILFDYEKPFIDFLLENDYLKEEKINGIKSLSVTEKGDNWIREKQK